MNFCMVIICMGPVRFQNTGFLIVVDRSLEWQESRHEVRDMIVRFGSGMGGGWGTWGAGFGLWK